MIGATADVFLIGYEHQGVTRRIVQEPWIGKVDTQFTGQPVGYTVKAANANIGTIPAGAEVSLDIVMTARH